MSNDSMDGALARLPGMRKWAQARYRERFRQPFGGGNLYYGVFDSYAAAQAESERMASAQLPPTYDLEAAGRMYRDQLQSIRVSDYPLVYWLERVFQQGARSVFDLGGNIGVTYYGFSRYLAYPEGLRWTVHDLPKVMAVGRQWAERHDAGRCIGFADSALDVDGQDVLVSTGALQYLPYRLPELIAQLAQPPRHVLVNLTPMHPTREFYTLQNLGIAVCPYRIDSVEHLKSHMHERGYDLLDEWSSRERHLEVPFHPEARVEGYSGFAFSRPVPAP